MTKKLVATTMIAGALALVPATIAPQLAAAGPHSSSSGNGSSSHGSGPNGHGSYGSGLGSRNNRYGSDRVSENRKVEDREGVSNAGSRRGSTYESRPRVYGHDQK
ncbi:hypothetical protein [Nocardia sp. NPDC050710]|uniref:hypothetical protein n=1 Tax=Nocardia sp. NPDC050710 TaxID=3157220 RepID=UPI0033F7345A